MSPYDGRGGGVYGDPGLQGVPAPGGVSNLPDGDDVGGCAEGGLRRSAKQEGGEVGEAEDYRLEATGSERWSV